LTELLIELQYGFINNEQTLIQQLK